MIKSSELRIGNRLRPLRVIDPSNIPLMGYSICAAHIAYSVQELNSDWEPIPLTTEILEKCGFKDRTEGYRATGAVGGVWVAPSAFNGKDIALYENWAGGKLWSYYLGHYELPITSVHQLQNLYFALTGEELGVKL